MSVEFDETRFENKIRVMVLDLLNPSARRMKDFQETLEELIRHDDANAKRIDAIEFNYAGMQGKMHLIDEVHKTAQDLKSQNISFEADIGQKVQLMHGNVDKSLHKVEDLSIKILTMDENYRSSRAEVADYTNTVNVIKGTIIEEHKQLVRHVEKAIAGIKEL